MTLEELEIILENLKSVQMELMKQFAYSIGRTHEYGYSPEFSIPVFKRLMEIQNLINDYERLIAVQKGTDYVNKFGEIVYSKSDLEFWNNLYDTVVPKKNDGPVMEMKH